MGPFRGAQEEAGRQDTVNSNGMSVHEPGDGGGRMVAHSTGHWETLGALFLRNFLSFL